MIKITHNPKEKFIRKSRFSYKTYKNKQLFTKLNNRTIK